MSKAPQAGFSLVEVLISLVLLSIGVLAAASSMAALTRMLAAGTVMTRVSVVGTNQMEGLLASGCDVTATSSSTIDGVTVWWSAGKNEEVMRIQLEMAYTLDYKPRVDSLTFVRKCPDVK